MPLAEGRPVGFRPAVVTELAKKSRRMRTFVDCITMHGTEARVPTRCTELYRPFVA